MKGVFGKYLEVDLSKGTVDEFTIPENWWEQHLGGRGIAARILLAEWGARIKEIQPLGAENILVFATGPLTGTGVAGASRLLVMSKSPKTKNLNGSYVGGHLPHELGKSGYDGIIIKGKAASPKYLSLIDGAAHVESAEELWGKDTADTEEWLRAQYGDSSRVASIGLAGENMVISACIMVDRTRAAGRPGLGAVMGAKNLKAVVVKGQEEKPVYDTTALKESAKNYAKALMEDPYSNSLREDGSAGTALEHYNSLGILPTKNFRLGTFPAVDKISGKAMSSRILIGRDSCFGCPIGCKRRVSTEFNGKVVEGRYGGPEFETLVAFGSLCGNSSLDAIALANQKCNQYGLDTISAGVAIAFLMEASERKLIDEDVKWGDPTAIVRLIDEIAQRKGLGSRVADGLDSMAREINADFAMTIKGQELPMHEPRGKASLAITYATTPRGAQHMEGVHDTLLEAPPLAPELGVVFPLERHDFAGKARITKIYEDFVSFNNSLIVCAYTCEKTGPHYNHPQLREILKHVTGRDLSIDECLSIGERNYVLLRTASSLAGYMRKDDRLPARFHEAIPTGPEQGRRISEKVLQKSIDEYYRLRGFDAIGPTKQTLRGLGLAEFTPLIDTLRNQGR